MLRSFRFSNHRSFRDEAELLFLPAYDKDRAAVPVVAIYGANAAGKSNVLDALEFMAGAVHDSYSQWRPEGGVPRRPFTLPRSDAESTYVVELLSEGVRYTYGFVVDDERVREEWLYSYPVRNRRRVLFDRQGPDVTLGKTLTEQRAKIDVLSDLTRPNALFLSLATQVGLADVLPVHRWFTNALVFSRVPVSEQLLAATVVAFLRRDLRNRARLLGLLQAADLGVSDLVIDTADSEIFHRAVEGQWVATDRLRLAHGPGDEVLDLREESAGTRSWLQLLLPALTVLDSGSLLVVDEIDSSLHPELSARLIRLFQSEELNPHGAQLLFTTHDATLLGPSFGTELLQRDQVWFVEKEADGSSRLYPLTDFHPRHGENRERRYLNGSYGAIPITSDLAVERAVTRAEITDVAAS